MLFSGQLTAQMPQFFGRIVRIPTLNKVPDKTLQANYLAILSNIGDIIEDAHACILRA